MRHAIIIFHVLVLFSARSTFAQDVDPSPFSDNSNHWYMGFDKERMINPMPGHPKYSSDQLTAIGDNMILFQKANGGWPKNYDMFAILTKSQKDSVASHRNELNTTFDNGTCFTQIAALSIVYTSTGITKYRDAALKGLDYLFTAQYANGGWPQYYPLEAKYSKEITFNDGAIEGIMKLLRDILAKKPAYAYLDDAYIKKAATAFEKGIDCILNTQINDKGALTAWCQQYDEHSLQPAWARKFEPPSICNGESAGIVLFLMSIDHPSPRVTAAVENAVKWFRDSRIYATRVVTVPAPEMVTSFRVSTTDRVVVADTTAPPIWTRYYELKTHKPLFCNRDSKVVYSLAEVDRERRDGYQWYTYAPQKVLDKYPAWRQKWGN